MPRIDTAEPLGENGGGIPRFHLLVGLVVSATRAAMTLRSATKTLLVLALGLPVVLAVLIWVRGLLASMGDEAGEAVIGHVGTACQVAWSISLVGLVIVLALVVLSERLPEE